MRLVFAETGGIPFKYVALTELPLSAEALRTRGFIRLQQSGRDTWVVAITGEGSAWAHLHLLRRHLRRRGSASSSLRRERPCFGWAPARSIPHAVACRRSSSRFRPMEPYGRARQASGKARSLSRPGNREEPALMRWRRLVP